MLDQTTVDAVDKAFFRANREQRAKNTVNAMMPKIDLGTLTEEDCLGTVKQHELDGLNPPVWYRISAFLEKKWYLFRNGFPKRTKNRMKITPRIDSDVKTVTYYNK